MPTSTFEDSQSNGRRDDGERVIDADAEGARPHGLGQRIDALAALMTKHPLLSIWIGIGAGYLLARIIHRD